MVVFEERKEGNERQTQGHNDANTTVENVYEDIEIMAHEAMSQKKREEKSTVVVRKSRTSIACKVASKEIHLGHIKWIPCELRIHQNTPW